MSPHKLPEKTYDELVALYYGRYRKLKQYQQHTDEALMFKARAKALEVQSNQELAKKQEKVDEQADIEDDAVFRQERMDEYERVYGEWDDAGDQALLINLVELEVQFRAIRRDLTRATTLGDKEKYWKALRENSEAQKSLQITLGIDKKTRELTRATGNPMDNWAEIKEELGDWVDMLVAEFPPEADKVKTEQELKDLIKVKLSWPFAIIDSVVYNLKRVNGILPIGEQSEQSAEDL